MARYFAALTILAALSGVGFGFPPQENGPPPPAADDDLVYSIDLASVLRLAGLENRDILMARQRVVSSMAQRQLAAAQYLPSLNAGLNYDAHTGSLQTSNAKILTINRDSLYVGSGAYAVGGGSVNIPGLSYNLNLSQTIYNHWISRQLVNAQQSASRAMENELLRQVAGAYLELLRTEGLRSLTLKAQQEAEAIFRITDAFARIKQGRQADADRAKTELEDRRIDHIEARQKVTAASARLAELLNLPPTLRMHPMEERLVPLAIVPDPLGLPELLFTALRQRPELAQRQALIESAFLELASAKALPFSPTVLLGISGATFGGGSSLAPAPEQRFGNFANRYDLDLVLYWTVQNLGLGNVAQIRAAASHTRLAGLAQIEVLNRVRSEVTRAHVRSQIYQARILASEKALAAGTDGFAKDFQRIANMVEKSLPIELLDSYRLLNRARAEYLDAIASFNEAQLDLYVALGQPPPQYLARTVPFRGEKLKPLPGNQGK